MSSIILPGPEETQKNPQGSYKHDEYPPGEWIYVTDMLRKKGRYGDIDYYTGRPKGAFNIRWILKPMPKRELFFRRIPEAIRPNMFILGYWQNIVDCADSKHRSNLRNQ